MKINRTSQKGFTLIELMIAVAVMGLLALVVGKLVSAGMQYWFETYAQITTQQKVRVARDYVLNNLRYATITSVMISKSNTAEPNSSMVSFVDVYGNTQSYYQQNGDLLVNDWRLGKPSAQTSKLISHDLQQFSVYYPNQKDFSHIDFSLYVKKWPYNTAQKQIQIQLLGSV